MTTWTPEQTALLHRLHEVAPPAGWRVVTREDGFDLERDLTQETRATETRASREYTRWRHLAHEVRFEADGTFVVTDVDDRVQLDRRGEDRGWTRSKERGLKVGGGFSMTFKFVDGRLRRIDDNRYDLGAGRKLVEQAAEEVGMTRWRARLGWEAKVGLFFALFTVVGLVVGGIVTAVLALTGNLPD